MNDSDLDRFNDGDPNPCPQCGAPIDDDNPREMFDSYAEEQGYGGAERIVLRSYGEIRRMNCCRTGMRYSAIIDAIAFLDYARERADHGEDCIPEEAIATLGEVFGHDFDADAWASFREPARQKP